MMLLLKACYRFFWALTIFSFILLAGCGENKNRSSIKQVSAAKLKTAQEKVKDKENLVKNPSFETGRKFNSGIYKKGRKYREKPLDWTTKNQFLNDSNGWAKDEVHNGKRSLKIKNLGGTDARWYGESIILSKPSSMFKVSIWTKVAELSAKNNGVFQISLKVFLKGRENPEKITVSLSKNNHDWCKTEKEFYFPADIIKVIPCFDFSRIVGTAWFDDFSIVCWKMKSTIIFDSNKDKLTGKYTETVNSNGDKIFSVQGQQKLLSSDFLPVYSGKIYKQSGTFKVSQGKQSILYVGYLPYTKYKKYIRPQYVNFIKGSETQLCKECQPGDKVIYLKDSSKWLSGSAKYIAFDVDISGKYSDLPNSKLSPGIQKMEKQTDSWAVYLKAPIGKKYPAGTYVREHYFGSCSAIYNAAHHRKIGKDWTVCRGIITSYNSKLELPKLYPGTKFVKILLLLNCASQSELKFKDLKIETQTKVLSDFSLGKN